MVRQTAVSQLAGRPVPGWGPSPLSAIREWSSPGKRSAVGVPARKVAPSTLASRPGCPRGVCLPSRCARDASHPQARRGAPQISWRQERDQHTPGGRYGHGFVYGIVAAVVPGTVGASMARQGRCGLRHAAAHLPRAGCRGAAGGAGAAGERCRAGRPGRLPDAEPARDAHRPLRGPAGRRRACRGKHPAHGGGGGVYRQSLRREDGGCRRGAPSDGSCGHEGRGRGDRDGGRRGYRACAGGSGSERRAAAGELLRVPCPGHGGAAVLVGLRRACSYRDQLHIRDHGAPEGCCLHAPGCLPELFRRDHPLPARREQRLSVDAADVPLQRLVHPLVTDRYRRHARVPARGPWRRDLGTAARARRHPPQRGPDRGEHHPERARGRARWPGRS